jgi:hypothetical protein
VDFVGFHEISRRNTLVFCSCWYIMKSHFFISQKDQKAELFARLYHKWGIHQFSFCIYIYMYIIYIYIFTVYMFLTLFY